MSSSMLAHQLQHLEKDDILYTGQSCIRISGMWSPCQLQHSVILSSGDVCMGLHRSVSFLGTILSIFHVGARQITDSESCCSRGYEPRTASFLFLGIDDI